MAFGNKEKKEQQRLQEEEARRAKYEAQQAQRKREEERLQAAKAKQALDIEEFLTSFRDSVRDTVANVGAATLHRQIYIPVDAQMNQMVQPAGLDLKEVNDLGAKGWAVEAVIPRTYGGFEAYSISKTTAYGVSGWGKDEHKVGLGGHIVGVYVLLAYRVDASNLESSGDVIDLIAKASLPEKLTAPVS